VTALSALAEGAVSDGLGPLLAALPLWVRETAFEGEADAKVEELALDLGRPLAVRVDKGYRYSDRPVTKHDLEYVVHRVPAFREDGRTGLEGTLHRIAAIREPYGELVGLTIRVGRFVRGVAGPLAPHLGRGSSLLLVGPPGVGKTTLLRDLTCLFAERHGPRVVVVDTSGEIAGIGRTPHPLLWPARRLPVPTPSRQAETLLQAVTNHGPEVIVVDEIGYWGDAEVIATIARRGVRVVATAHGSSLRDVADNPDLAPLLGLFSRTQERFCPAAFDMALELRSRGHLHLHTDLRQAVTNLFAGNTPEGLPICSTP
jgi:stage III sporulation protein SpoIIIAA